MFAHYKLYVICNVLCTQLYLTECATCYAQCVMYSSVNCAVHCKCVTYKAGKNKNIIRNCVL